MNEQKGKKPGEDQISLPPLRPNWDLPLEKGEDPTSKRIGDLPLQGYSVAIYAKKQQLTLHQKENLILAFKLECHNILGFVLDQIKRIEEVDDQERISLSKAYQLCCERLNELVKISVFNNTADDFKFSEIFYSYYDLLSNSLFLYSLRNQKLHELLKRKLEGKEPKEVTLLEFIKTHTETPQDKATPHKKAIQNILTREKVTLERIPGKTGKQGAYLYTVAHLESKWHELQTEITYLKPLKA